MKRTQRHSVLHKRHTTTLTVLILNNTTTHTALIHYRHLHEYA